MNSPEQIHPALWRASQLGHAHGRTLDSGFRMLNRELPGQGWPLGQLMELLIDEPGTLECRLLLPALRQLSQGALMLVAPPYVPQISGLSHDDSFRQRLVWVNPALLKDRLWATEQILRHRSSAAVLLWADQLRNDQLRRLHLLAQQTESLLCLIRPMSVAQTPSPAALRIAALPASYGMQVRILKRRGQAMDQHLPLYLPAHPYLSDLQHDRQPAVAQPAQRVSRLLQ